MGQARRRGTLEQRVASARIRRAEEQERARVAHEAWLRSPTGRSRVRGSQLALQLLAIGAALGGGFR